MDNDRDDFDVEQDETLREEDVELFEEELDELVELDDLDDTDPLEGEAQGTL